MHLAVIRLLDKSPEHHHYVFEAMRNFNIGVQLHYLPVHLHPYYRRLGFNLGDFPEAESYARNAISLPLYPGLGDRNQERVVQSLKSIFSSAS